MIRSVKKLLPSQDLIFKIIFTLFIAGILTFMIYYIIRIIQYKKCHISSCATGFKLNENLCACESIDLNDNINPYPESPLMRCIELDCRENEKLDYVNCNCITKNACSNLECGTIDEGKIANYKTCNCDAIDKLPPKPPLRCPWLSYDPVKQKINIINCTAVNRDACKDTVCKSDEIVNYSNCTCLKISDIGPPPPKPATSFLDHESY